MDFFHADVQVLSDILLKQANSSLRPLGETKYHHQDGDYLVQFFSLTGNSQLFSLTKIKLELICWKYYGVS
jgi:hypothetical protein